MAETFTDGHLPPPAQPPAGLAVTAQGTPPGVTRTTMDSSGDAKEGPRCELEDFTRCSESHLWKLMMSYYDRKGIDAWSQGVVPHFITCNAFIGRAYAKVLQGFLRDCASGSMMLDPTQPLYIIELGTGSGKFSYYMLKALEEMSATLDFPVAKIVYVMTDFTDANVGFWRNHPQLKPFFDSGQMDSAVFDAVSDGSITLSESGVTLGPGTVVNPLCVVANYLFDTLCHDIFQVTPAPLGSPAGTPGVLKEGLISVGSKRAEEPDPLEPEIIKRLDNRFRYDAIDDDYYASREDGDDGPHLRRIMAWYRDYFSGIAPALGAEDTSGDAPSEPPDRSGASILVPIGALRALRRLTAFSAGRCLVVSGDKGNNNPDQFRGLMDPHIAVHGSFSVMVGKPRGARPPPPTPLRGAQANPHLSLPIALAGELPCHWNIFHVPRRLCASQPSRRSVSEGLKLGLIDIDSLSMRLLPNGSTHARSSKTMCFTLPPPRHARHIPRSRLLCCRAPRRAPRPTRRTRRQATRRGPGPRWNAGTRVGRRASRTSLRASRSRWRVSARTTSSSCKRPSKKTPRSLPLRLWWRS